MTRCRAESLVVVGIVAGVLGLVGCRNRDTPEPSPATPSAVPSQAAAPAPAAALTRTTATVRGLSQSATFTIELPSGLTEKRGEFGDLRWSSTAPDDSEEIYVDVGIGLEFPESLDDAAERAAPMRGDKVLSKATIDNGYIVVAQDEDGTSMSVSLWRKVGSANVVCGVTHRIDEGVPTSRRAGLEAICRSLTPA